MFMMNAIAQVSLQKVLLPLQDQCIADNMDTQDIHIDKCILWWPNFIWYRKV